MSDSMQAVIGTKTGDSYQFELDEQQTHAVIGKQIGDEVDGDAVGLDGYTLEITGGSDREGFPMRATIQGTGRRRVLISNETGAKRLRDGERRRKSVRGNTVSDDIEQLNLTVVEDGSKSVDELLNPDEAADEEPDEADDTASESATSDEEPDTEDEPAEEADE